MSNLSTTLLCLVAVGPLMIPLQIASQTAGIALHEDIGSIVLGVIVSVAGLSALGLSFFRWQRKDLSLLSFGVFCILYGIRLLAEAQSIRILVDVGPQTWSYIMAFITYVIPIPLSAFLVQLLGRGWGNSMLWVLRATILFALAAILSDFLRAAPFTASSVNNVLVILWAILLLANVLRPGLKMTREMWSFWLGF